MIAKITYKNDDKVKYIANAINLKGFLGGEKNIGVGEKREICFQTEDGDYDVIEKFEKYNKMYMPFYCTEKIKKNYKGGAATFKKEVAGKNPDLRDLVGTYLEKYLIKWGDNESIFVEDSEIAQRNLEKKIEAKILSKEMAIKIGHSNCGFYFKDRVPNSIFNLVRNVGEYWSKAKVKEWNEDCDDWNEAGHAGWYFSNEMISILKQNNYEIEQ